MRSTERSNLTDLVAARLRREIVEGAFEFGEALSEIKIAKRYDVSRTPVREAFARLELENLVRIEPQSGTFVFTMNRTEFALISETRSVLERAALRYSHERESEQLLDAWRESVAAMSKALAGGEMKRYSDLDGAFHDALFDCAGNPYLEAARQTFAARMTSVRNRLGITPEHTAKSFGEHERLLALVTEGEVDRAEELLDLHIRKKGATFWAVPETPRRPAAKGCWPAKPQPGLGRRSTGRGRPPRQATDRRRSAGEGARALDARQTGSRHAPVAKAMDYMLTCWDRFARCLRVCLSNNTAERGLRGVALGRKSWLFAGSDRGGERPIAVARGSPKPRVGPAQVDRGDQRLRLPGQPLIPAKSL